MKNKLIPVAAVLLIVSCSQQKTSVVSQNSVEIIPVKVVKAEERSFSPAIELSGTAYADMEANLGAALPGRVEKIYFPEGSNVKKGDLLVSLSGELYTQALVEFTTIEKDYQRVTRLIEKGSVTQQEYDHVKAMYEAEKSKVEMLKKNAEIIAPFSGTIVEYLVHEGENYFFNINLDPGYSRTSGILRLMKTDPIQVEAEVNEKDLSEIRKGQSAEVTFDAIGDSVYTGKISFIKPALSTLTHSATIRVEVKNTSGIIKPGMYAHVKAAGIPVNAVFVPTNAIYRQAGTSDDYVFTVDGNKAGKKKINRLFSDNTFSAVTGIVPGTVVVVSGKEKLTDGSLVEVK
jgi:membrane fusion protein, multidrug efflux system